jgi:hypothetical protein
MYIKELLPGILKVLEELHHFLLLLCCPERKLFLLLPFVNLAEDTLLIAG